MTNIKRDSLAGAWKRAHRTGWLSAFLVILLAGCSTLTDHPTVAVQSDTMWTKTESPLLPTSWPPTPDTVWVRYTFAYGMNPTTLMDGNYVTSPLSKIEWQAGRSTTTVLTDEMTQAAIQGVMPLDDAASRILETGAQVSTYCLSLTSLPDLQASETRDMLAYYSAWFKYNGAFLALVGAQHADFIAWVMANQ